MYRPCRKWKWMRVRKTQKDLDNLDEAMHKINLYETLMESVIFKFIYLEYVGINLLRSMTYTYLSLVSGSSWEWHFNIFWFQLSRILGGFPPNPPSWPDLKVRIFRIYCDINNQKRTKNKIKKCFLLWIMQYKDILPDQLMAVKNFLFQSIYIDTFIPNLGLKLISTRE